MQSKIQFDKSNFISYKKDDLSKEYKLGKILGQGSCGKVRMAIHIKTQQIRAVKIIKKKLLEEEKFFLEVNILAKLSHPNIMQIYEFYEDVKNYYIISEFCSGGELFDMIINKGCFSEKEAANIMKQLLSAICYCHNNKIVHRDLKPENILIEDKDSSTPIIKLCDWGGARYFSKKKRKMTKINGTPYYIAPEVLKEVYDEKCDIWSLGVILYILLSGTPPFKGDTYEEIYSNISKGEYSFPNEEWGGISNEAKALVKKMLTYNPKERISASQCLNDPWLINESKIGNIKKSLAKKSILNMKKFKRNRQLEQATISYISNQLIAKEDFKELSKIFKEWDKNGDGVLNKEEIIEGYKKAYGTVDVSEIDTMIKNVDLDGDGNIDYNEFLNCTMNKNKILQNNNLELAFSAFDKDGNGFISMNELMIIFKTSEYDDVDKSIIENILKEADANKDGQIDLEEFKKIMTNFFTQQD